MSVTVFSLPIKVNCSELSSCLTSERQGFWARDKGALGINPLPNPWLLTNRY